MPAKRLLRLLILVQIPVALAMGLASYLSMSSLPGSLRYLSTNKDALVPGATALAVAGAVAFLIANVCLYVLLRGARTFYLVITVVLPLMALFLGPFVSTGWTDIFDACFTLLSGLILGLIYFSPARELFQQQAGTNSIERTTELDSSPAGFPDPTPGFAVETPVEARSARAGGPLATAVPATMFCAACGAPGQGGRFCPQCGKPLVAKRQCPRCGADVEPGKKFCRDCGAPMFD